MLCQQNENISGNTVRLRVASLLLATALGFIPYAQIWPQLIAHSTYPWSDWSYTAIGIDWLKTITFDFPWLIIVVVALLATLRSPLKFSPAGASILALVLTIFFSLLVMRHPPFPRTYVPFFPIAAMAIGWAVSAFLQKFVPSIRYSWPLLAVSCLSIIGWTQIFSPCAADASVVTYGANLCRQYYRGKYLPHEVYKMLQALAKETPTVAIANTEAGFALYYLLENYDIPPSFSLMDSSQWVAHNAQLDPRAVVYSVAKNMAEAKSMADGIVHESHNLRMVHDTGYFKMFSEHGE